MPNTKAAAKTVRQDAKRIARNRAAKSTLKTMIKKFRETVASGKAEEISAGLSKLFGKLDQAASKKIIHANKAARLKSRLAHFVKSKTGATAS